jgi:error-prone DNA polymerase
MFRVDVYGMAPDPHDPAKKIHGRVPHDIFIPLCRSRHKGIYAEGKAMPIPFSEPRNSR